MIGITGYGAYVPKYRMDRSVVLQQMGWFARGMAKGEKAVANHDEDAVTMAHAAARAALAGADLSAVEAFHLASLSLPYKVRQNAVIVAEALSLGAKLRAADYTSSSLCGATALLAALDAVGAGSVRQAVACASDARRAKPASAQDYLWGDAAAAVRVGKDDVIASFLGAGSLARDFIDKYMIDAEEFEHNWEDRWIRDEGYMKMIPEVIGDLLAKTGTAIGDYKKVCIACPNPSAVKAIAKRCKLDPECLVDNLVGPVGDTGSAMPLLMLAAALETAAPGDKILVVGFGFGAQALAFEATGKLPGSPSRGCLAKTMARRAPLTEYVRYLTYKGLVQPEVGIRGESVAATAMSVLHQQGRAISCLEGERCTACGTIQFPKHRVCVNPECNAVGNMEPYLFSDKIGTIASFTVDSLAFTWSPPQLDGMLDFADGGRIFMDFTDCGKDDIKVGAAMEMTFRRKYSDKLRGYYGYFWKATPAQ